MGVVLLVSLVYLVDVDEIEKTERRMNRYTKRVSTALSQTLYERLAEYADRELITPSSVLRQAVAFFLVEKTRNTSDEGKEDGSVVEH